MKKAISALLAATLLVTGAGVASAADLISVKIDDKVQTYDQPPVVLHDRTMVPMRGIFEALGCTIEWDELTQTVTAHKDKLVVKMTVGSTKATIGSQTYTMDQAPVVVNDRTLVPVRFVSNALSARVDWDEATKTVSIHHYPDLVTAAEKDDLVKVKALVAAGADINVKNYRDATPLAQAVAYGSTDMVKYFLDLHANPNTADVDGDSPLQYAVGTKRLDIVKLLLPVTTATLNLRDRFGLTPLGWAKKQGYTDIADALKAAGAVE